MKHEQLLEYAQSALTTLEQGNVKGASNDLRNLLAGLIQAKTALEAEPLEAPTVLAVVEVCAMQVEDGPDYKGTLWIEREHEGKLYIGYECPETACVRPVTVTITERKT